MPIAITLFLMFLKIGFTSFGGGYGMMSMILDEGIARVGLTTAEFADMAALDLLCSGPVAVNAATYIGYIKGGWLGALLATIGAVLPSLMICTVVVLFLDRFHDSKIVKGLFVGIVPATGGLMIFTALKLSRSIFFNAETFHEILSIPITPTTIGMTALFVAALIAAIKFKVNPIWLTLAGAVIGAMFLA